MEARSLDIEAHPNAPDAPAAPGELTAAERRQRRGAWIAFALVVVAIVVSDQLLKAYVVGHYSQNEITPLIGDWLRIQLIHNSGGLFGTFQNQVTVFAAISVVVMFLLVAIEWRSGWRSWLTTVALSLLLGGAIGNFIDRVTLGYVVDFADIGMGTWRWYIFNIADSAVSVSICLLVLLAFIAPRALSLKPEETEGDRERPGDASAEPAASDPDRLDA